MAQQRRRYTTVDRADDWIVSVSWDEQALDRAHWFEAKVEAIHEKTGARFPFPREIATFRIGEIEHSFRDYVRIDWNGDREAAVRHLLDSLYRRVYACVERGH